MKTSFFIILLMSIVNIYSQENKLDQTLLESLDSRAHNLYVRLTDLRNPITCSELKKAKKIKKDADVLACLYRVNGYSESRTVMQFKKALMPYLIKEEKSLRASHEVTLLKETYAKTALHFKKPDAQECNYYGKKIVVLASVNNKLTQ